MNETSWRRLLDQIHDGRVVPVVGSELLVMGADGKSLQRMIAERLLAMHDQPPPEEWPASRELDEAVMRLVRLKYLSIQDLYCDIHYTIRQLISTGDNVIPTPIRQLTEITDFRMFVTLTPDNLLACSLRKRCAVNEIVHSPELATSEGRDLPADWRDRSSEVQLLYLFGKSCSAPVFAINDEDFLEYAHSMITSRGLVPVRFFGELQEHNLMLIGCHFPDWLSRLFLRITNKARLSATTAKCEWLIERMQPCETSLVNFLENYSRRTKILDMAPLDFVAELHRRWTADGGPPSVPAAGQALPAGATFFISYSRSTDLPRAEALVQALLRLGLSEREVWFDRRAIEPGDDFRQRILDGIGSCRYFLPLLSEAATGREEGFVFREWRAANDRREEMNRDFIYPVIVDAAYEPERYHAEPVRDWRGLHFGHAPGGIPDADTLTTLTRLLRETRKSGN